MNKSEQLFLERIREVKGSLEADLCKVYNCDAKSIEQGLCLKHYQSHIRRKERGGVMLYRPKPSSHDKICTIDDCTEEQAARGLCRVHLQQKIQEEQKPKVSYGGTKRFTLSLNDINFLLEHFEMLPPNFELKNKLTLAAQAGDSFEWFSLRENEHRQLKEFLWVPEQYRQMLIEDFLDDFNSEGAAGTNKATSFCFNRRDIQTIEQVLQMTMREIGMLRNLGVKKRHILFNSLFTCVNEQNERED